MHADVENAGFLSAFVKGSKSFLYDWSLNLDFIHLPQLSNVKSCLSEFMEGLLDFKHNVIWCKTGMSK